MPPFDLFDTVAAGYARHMQVQAIDLEEASAYLAGDDAVESLARARFLRLLASELLDSNPADL